MRIVDLLEKKQIFLDFDASEREELILQISAKLEEVGVLRNGEELAHELLKRESQGSTAVGNGVALPHARLKNLNRIFISFVRTKSGIDFKAPDEKKVQLFFIIGTPLEKVADYLKLLAKLSKLLKKKDLVAGLLNASSEQEVIALIEEFEEKPI